MKLLQKCLFFLFHFFVYVLLCSQRSDTRGLQFHINNPAKQKKPRVSFKRNSHVVSYHGSSLSGWTLPLDQTRPQKAPWSQHRAERSPLQWKGQTCYRVIRQHYKEKARMCNVQVLLTFDMIAAPKIWKRRDCFSLWSWKQA